jgi:hypothetical protein
VNLPVGTSSGAHPFSAAIADFDGDGNNDLAIALRFQALTDPGFIATTPYGIVVGDFNGDGKIDFATANAASNDLAVRLNTGQKQ